MTGQCNCEICRMITKEIEKMKNNAEVIECGEDCDCITINGLKMCKKGKGINLANTDIAGFGSAGFPEMTGGDVHFLAEGIKFAPQPSIELQYMFLVDVVKDENNNRRIIIRVLGINNNENKHIGINMLPSEGYIEVMRSFFDVLDEYKPTKVYFDKSLHAEGFKGVFEKEISKSYIAMNVDEDGAMSYR